MELAFHNPSKSEITMYPTTPHRFSLRQVLALGASVVLLSACGGGGGSSGSGPVASSLTFPLATAYQAPIATGEASSFTISGSCTGSGTHTVAAANTPVTFEGVAALSATSTWSMAFNNCMPTTLVATSTAYYDSNYQLLGSWALGGSYGVYLTPPSIPGTVTVGSSGTIGTETLYTDSTKAVGDGSSVLSYVVEADTATTAIIKLVTTVYSATGTLTGTEQDRYRITSTGALTPVTTDIQYAGASLMHLVLTY
jgi:hypothetical protein